MTVSRLLSRISPASGPRPGARISPAAGPRPGARVAPAAARRQRGLAATLATLLLAAMLPVSSAGPAAAAPADPALAPYRELARSPDARRLLAVARTALELHWSTAPADTARVPDWPGAPTTLYLSLVRGGVTRSCVGSPVPPRGSLAECVRALAEAALVADPRHPPVRRDELAALRVVLSFAGAGAPVADPMSVDPGREGLLVGGARGHVAFLPGEARTVAWALREARRVGVLDPAQPTEFTRFPVVTITEPEPKSPRGEAADEDE
jgi:AMMECR1 domain-containing protein